MTTIKLKNGSGAPAGGDLVQGEPALDLTNKRLYTENGSGTVIEVGTNPTSITTGDITATGTASFANLATTGNITFGDDDKAIFGAGSDLQIYHDGTHSYIKDAGTGNLNILASTSINLLNGDSSDYMARFSDNGSNQFFYDGSQKLATTSTGIDVTGTATMDGLDVQGNVIINNSYAYQIGGDSASSSVVGKMHNSSGMFTLASLDSRHMKLTTSNADRLKVDANGDISFYEDTGTTAKFFWDASAESLGIGTSSIDGTLHLDGGTSSDLIIEKDATGSAAVRFHNAGSQLSYISLTSTEDMTYYGASGVDQIFYAGGSERMRLDSSGNVGIGTDSPTSVQGFAKVLKLEDSSNASIVVSGGSHEAEYAVSSSGGWFGTSTNIPQRFATNNAERMRIDASGNVFVNQSSTASPGFGNTTTGLCFSDSGRVFSSASGAGSSFNRNSSDGDIIQFRKDSTQVGSIGTDTSNSDLYIGNGDTAIMFHDGTDAIFPHNASTNASRDAAIDIGYSTYRFKDLHLSGDVNAGGLDVTLSTNARGQFHDNISEVGSGNFAFQVTNSAGTSLKPMGFRAEDIRFATSSSERMRLDSSGNLLVGKTTSDGNTVGSALFAAGDAEFVKQGTVLYLNRKDSDGDIVQFRKDGTTVGSIGVSGSNNLYITSAQTNHAGLTFATDAILPTRQGAIIDDVTDLGASSERFDNVYATNGTIQTSDRNEKQDIEALSDAEQRVAVAAKGLLRKFRWKSSVVDKGDDARIHFGIIAQDLQDAFTAEGLDAGRYGMFINSTWTDEETGEERSRMGVRYSELLAFIIAAI